AANPGSVQAGDYTDIICEGETYTKHNFNLPPQEAGTHFYQNVIVNPAACTDGAEINLTLTVMQRTTYLREAICHGQSYSGNGFEVKEPPVGMFRDTIKTGTVNGCDTYNVLELTVSAGEYTLPKIIESETQPCTEEISTYAFSGAEGLSHFEWIVPSNAVLYKSSRFAQIIQLYFTDDSPSVLQLSWKNGCGSGTEQLNITPRKSYSIQKNEEVCQGENFNMYNFNLGAQDEVGYFVYSKHVTSKFGCDSVVTLALSVLPKPVPRIEPNNMLLCSAGEEITLWALTEGMTYPGNGGGASDNPCGNFDYEKWYNTLKPNAESDFEIGLMPANDGTCYIARYWGTNTDIVVPRSVNGYIVTYIPSGSFKYTAVTSIVLPPTTNVIISSAFTLGSQLMYITVPKTAIFEISSSEDHFPQAIIRCYENSSAHQYAKDEGKKIELIEDCENEDGVVINGVKWATCNVDAPGTFAKNPENAGMYYQWNRSKGWIAAGTGTGWNSSNQSGTEWEKANDPCPEGWRVPTLIELKNLLKETNKGVWTTNYKNTGVAGRIFTYGTSELFFPAAGGLNTLGHVWNAGEIGTYWSSTPNSGSDAYFLSFTNTEAKTDEWGAAARAVGRSIRCVKDNFINVKDNFVTINIYDCSLNYLWNTGSTKGAITVKPTQTTEYSVEVTTQNSCSAKAKQTVVVHTNAPQNINATICEGETYAEYGLNAKTAGVYPINIKGGDCPVMLNVNLSVTKPVVTKITDKTCAGALYQKHGLDLILIEPGIFKDTIRYRNAQGCIDIIALEISVYPGYLPGTESYFIYRDTICQNEIYNKNGFNLGKQEIAGKFTHTNKSKNVHNCEVADILQLVVNPVYTNRISDVIDKNSAYAKYNFNFAKVTKDTTATVKLLSVEGCDSTVILNLKVKDVTCTPPTVTIAEKEICQNNSIHLQFTGIAPFELDYTFNGTRQKITVSGMNTTLVATQAGENTFIAHSLVDKNGCFADFLDENGVKINDVVWAKYNVDAPGTFAANPQDAGKFYQWNRKVAWATTGTVIGWNTTNPVGATWEKQNDPCPTGYRVPTKAEQDALVNFGSTWTFNYNGTGVAGRIFGSGSNTVFFPAVGSRYHDGMLGHADTYGYYWSSTELDSYTYFVFFGSDNVGVWGSNPFRTDGYSIRCVKDLQNNKQTNTITVNKVDNLFIADTIFVGKSYNKHGFSIPVQTAAGTIRETLRLQNQALCDSLVILNLKVLCVISDTTKIADTIFVGRSYNKHGFLIPIQTAETTIFDTLRLYNQFLCDSTVLLNLEVICPNDTLYIADTIFVGESYNKYGFSIPAQHRETTVFDTLRLHSQFLCDSAVILNLKVIFNCESKIPNVFTPNDDGINDIYLEGMEVCFKNIIILNRWGQTMYEGSAGWDGRQNNGVQAAPGTYFYIITTHSDKIYRGALMLLRQ
ncbi:MAG: gliding motility-associated C-terminal domain-containing protein, partial [Bacteroidetes bacterium]|nr:gliding motility-associated C-terminal domain-containing protein [Bacteroidota bacterium]